MGYYLKTIFTVFFLCGVISCKSNHSTNHYIPSKECIKLNNSGVNFLVNYPMNGKNGLKKSVESFKSAIQCDSNYLLPYLGLSSAYEQQHDRAKELVTINKILILTNNEPTFLTMKGMLYERMNDNDSAKNCYTLSKVENERRMLKNAGKIELIKNMIQLKALTLGKDSALREIDNQIKRYPQLSKELSQEEVFYKDFIRHAYIYGNAIEIINGKAVEVSAPAGL